MFPAEDNATAKVNNFCPMKLPKIFVNNIAPASVLPLANSSFGITVRYARFAIR